jgi:hypothetical protein
MENLLRMSALRRSVPLRLSRLLIQPSDRPGHRSFWMSYTE